MIVDCWSFIYFQQTMQSKFKTQWKEVVVWLASILTLYDFVKIFLINCSHECSFSLNKNQFSLHDDHNVQCLQNSIGSCLVTALFKSPSYLPSSIWTSKKWIFCCSHKPSVLLITLSSFCSATVRFNPGLYFVLAEFK